MIGSAIVPILNSIVNSNYKPQKNMKFNWFMVVILLIAFVGTLLTLLFIFIDL